MVEFNNQVSIYINIHISWIGFVEWRVRSDWSKPTAFTFVEDKIKAGKAGTITVRVVSAEDLVRAWWYRVVVLLLVHFISEGGSAVAFQENNNVCNEMLGVTVFSKGKPSAMVDMTSTKGFFRAILESLLWCQSVTMASENLIALHDSRQAMIPTLDVSSRS